MNIIIINHYAGSPEMGMEYRPYYFAKEWIKFGHNVTIIAGNYSHIRRINPEFETNYTVQNTDGIEYLWIKTSKYRGNGIGRIKNMFDYIRKLTRKAKYISSKYKPDVVIASSTYPSDNYIARKIAKLNNAKYVYEVHDLWPLSLIELGGMSVYHPFVLLMQHGENYAYKKADIVISMLPETREHMKYHGLDLKKWYYIPNGIDPEEWSNRIELNLKTQNFILDIRKKYSYIIAYTGTLGLANSLDTLIHSAKLIENFSVAVVIVGKGPEKNNLLKLVEKEKIINVFFGESISKQEIPALMLLFDILYIGLKYQPLFRFGISPNKMMDYMMSGKPIIQSINAGNNMVKEAGCGFDIESENPEAVAQAIKKLIKMSKNELQLMGENGKKFVTKNHVYQVLAKKYIDIFQKINDKFSE